MQELEKRLKEAQANEDGVDLDELEHRGKELAKELQGLKARLKTHQDWKQAVALFESKQEDRKRYQDQVDKALDSLTPDELSKQCGAAGNEVARIEAIRDTHRDWENSVQNWNWAQEKHEDQLVHLNNGRCFTCNSKLKDKEVKAIREHLLDEKEPGKEPPKPEGLEAAQEKFQALKDRVNLAREYTGFLKSRPLPADPGPEPDHVDQAQIEDLEETLRGVRDEYTAAKASAQATIDAMSEQLAVSKQNLEANTDLQDEASGDVERLQAVEDALHPASGVFAQALEQQLEGVYKLLPDWEFQLAKITKTTGNVTPCFQEFLKLGKHTVPLRYCSSGQQLASGVDLCLALDKLNGGKLGMVFVDNCELLSGHLNLDEAVQEFRCVVTDGNLEVLDMDMVTA